MRLRVSHRDSFKRPPRVKVRLADVAVVISRCGASVTGRPAVVPRANAVAAGLAVFFAAEAEE